MQSVRVLVLGASGMLGNAMVRVLAVDPALEVSATVRRATTLRHFDRALAERIIVGVDVENVDSVIRLFSLVQPDVVVNCVGLVKQLAEADDPLLAVPLNTLLPHRLARLCAARGARLIHVSTDCVFSGKRGLYNEADTPDAYDLYGKSKLLGEVSYPNAITLRTSIIGRELEGHRSLIGWFLEQPGPVKGFRKAIFSGLPTVELATIVRDHVLRRPDMSGLYHVAASPINKCDLLHLVADTYGKRVTIEPSDDVVVDRSLDATRFNTTTGYAPPPWPELVRRMYTFN
jgi:dTDP-4-dehydrorhamnose reductase